MKWKDKVKQLRTEVHVLYLAVKDPRTPWYARVFVLAIIAYALSPVDLIPDFIPVLGLIDDLILVPAGIYLALKMVPGDVLEEYRRKAKSEILSSKSGWIAAVIIILLWLLAISLLIMAIL